MRSFAFQIVLEGDTPFGPVDAGFEAGGATAVTSVKIPEDVAGEMESVLKGLGTNFSQVVRLLALQTTALGGMPFAAGIPPGGEMRGRRLPGWPWAPFLSKAPTRMPCGHERTVPAA